MTDVQCDNYPCAWITEDGICTLDFVTLELQDDSSNFICLDYERKEEREAEDI